MDKGVGLLFWLPRGQQVSHSESEISIPWPDLKPRENVQTEISVALQKCGPKNFSTFPT